MVVGYQHFRKPPYTYDKQTVEFLPFDDPGDNSRFFFVKNLVDPIRLGRPLFNPLLLGKFMDATLASMKADYTEVPWAR